MKLLNHFFQNHHRKRIYIKRVSKDQNTDRQTVSLGVNKDKQSVEWHEIWEKYFTSVNEKVHFARSFNGKYEQQLIVKSSATSTNVSNTSSSGIRTS